ncbi:MAG: carbohydrate kinase family protein [Puniceicoccales bacterium]|jgi:sugar/nucleoside kinase (ribokinase family)|nr:carbohydrate kinase family protein [Puniceicoccales bacterium]
MGMGNICSIRKRRIVVGLDGFVDRIVHAVDVRDGETYSRIETISDFGKRIISAAGKSTNIELVQQKRLVGGNGPLLAGALRNFGANVEYIGALGDCENNIFRDFARGTSATSIGDHGETLAVEFSDGKIIFGEMLPLHEISVASILAKMPDDDLRRRIDLCDALALVNWTMIPHMAEVARFFADVILPRCAERNRVFFFDLADPSKRKQLALAEFLQIIHSFEKFGQAVLGLNVSEAQQVLQAIGESSALNESREELQNAAELLRKALGIANVFIHGIKVSAAATAKETAATGGYFVANPQLSTGAGDHYNAGFLAAYLCGCTMDFAVNFAAATAAFYVKMARSPKIEDVKILEP